MSETPPPPSHGGDDADAMAAADAMMAAAGGGDEMPAELSQDDIDRLMNAGEPEPELPGRWPSAITMLVSSTAVNRERLPMLDVVLDRMVRLLNTSLRQLSSSAVEASLVRVDWIRFSDFLETVQLTSLLGIARAEPWDSQMIVAIDSALTYCMMDVLLGGRRSKPARAEGRPYTSIERKLAERLIRVAMLDLAQSFEPLSHVEFALDRLETDPRFATIARNTDVTLRARIAVSVENRVGHIDIVIPNAALDSIRDQLMQVFMGEKFGQDSKWETHFKAELQRTSIELVAVLHRTEMTLDEVLQWEAGDALELRISPDSRTVLISGEIELFSGQMGQRNENISVMIETDLGAKGDLIDDVVSR